MTHGIAGNIRRRRAPLTLPDEPWFSRIALGTGWARFTRRTLWSWRSSLAGDTGFAL
ncbi:MAG: hypothetical protein R3A46_15255 [Thermomicrobiales bacterium]